MENAGQLPNPEIRYYAARGNLAVGFAVGAIHFVFTQPAGEARGRSTLAAYSSPSKGVALRLTFEGGNRATPEATGELPYATHFFLGNDSRGWRTDVRSFREVVYPGVWTGIDLAYTMAAAGPKYEFLLASGARSGDIRIRYEGVTSLALTASGDLVASTALGDVRDSAPLAFRGGRPEACAFVLLGPRTVGFSCNERGATGPLTIDPLVYATFLGGSGQDEINAIALDGARNAYVTGYTSSPDFPVTPGAFDMTGSGTDAFVAKLRPDGRALLFATFLGGAQRDQGSSLAVDAAGNAYVTGYTRSSDFPTTPGALDRTCGTDGNCNYDGGVYLADAFLSVVGPNGDNLAYSTFLGGRAEDIGTSIALGSGNEPCIAGYTTSPDFPTTLGASDTSLDGSSDEFVARLNVSGGTLVYATLLGGSGGEVGGSLALDGSGAVYVTGATNSTDFPTTPGAFDTSHNDNVEPDAFVMKVSPDGSALVYSTYLGGMGDDTGSSIAVDPAGSAYVAGSTWASDFPVTPGAFDTTFNELGRMYDGFVAKFDPSGGGLAFSTFLGGDMTDFLLSITLDAEGNVFISGATTSSDFPTTRDALDRTFGPTEDGVFAVLNRTGAALLYSTFLGGTGSREGAWSMARGADGSVYLAGVTTSSDFPITAGAFDTIFGGVYDGFVVRLLSLPDLVIVPGGLTTVPPSPLAGLPADVIVNVTNSGESGADRFDTTAFDDWNLDGKIDPGEPFATIAAGPVPSGESVALDFRWTPATAGTHRVCAWADPDNRILETNEGNNAACVDVVVGPAPPTRPDYVPWLPEPWGSVRVSLGTVLALSLEVRNVGNETAASVATVAFRNESMSPFVTSPVAPLAPDATSPRVGVSWVAPTTLGVYTVIADVDYGDSVTEWNETNNEYAWSIDVVPGPVTSLVFGQPNVTMMETFVTSATPLSFSVLDQSRTGIRNTTYRSDGGPWRNFTVTGPFTFASEGEHLLEWFSVDFAGNVETVANATLRVDDTPPAVSTDVGAPRYQSSSLYVSPATAIAVNANDGGASPVGLASLEVRTGGMWATYAAPLRLSGPDGPVTVEFRASDLLGNGASGSLTVVLDGTPPTTMITPGVGPHPEVTKFALSVVDLGSGPARTEYAVDGGAWTPYLAPFALPVGDHTIVYRSVDHVDNLEGAHEVQVRIGGPLPPVPETNWKPLIALSFAATLAVVGAWASRRSPWKHLTGRKAVLAAFAATALPFVFAEGVTGVLSLTTGLLSIPPVLGIGTALDSGVLATGLVVAVLRGRLKPAKRRASWR